MTEQVLKRFKSYVDTDDLSGAQLFFQGVLELEDLPADYLYQKIYLHACFKKRTRFVDWMNSLFESMDPIEKIALRQMFSYGRYLLNK